MKKKIKAAWSAYGLDPIVYKVGANYSGKTVAHIEEDEDTNFLDFYDTDGDMMFSMIASAMHREYYEPGY